MGNNRKTELKMLLEESMHVPVRPVFHNLSSRKQLKAFKTFKMVHYIRCIYKID